MFFLKVNPNFFLKTKKNMAATNLTGRHLLAGCPAGFTGVQANLKS